MIYPNFEPVKVNFLLDLGGLGDNIARLPAIEYITNKHKHVRELVWIPDYFFPIAKLALPNVNFKKFSENAKYNEKLPGRSTGVGWFTNLKSHMTEHAFYLLANELPDVQYRNYIKLNLKSIGINRFNLPKKYVVICCGYTAKIREFFPQYINEIVQYLKSKDFVVVFLGKKETSDGLNHIIEGTFKEEINLKEGINLIDKTSLLEAAKIMEQSKLVIGLDSGLTHVAACTDVPIVCGYTSVNPLHRMPYRNNQMGWNFFPVVPPLNEPERFMQSSWDFCFDVDFKESYYGNDNLIKSLTSDLYIKEIEKII